MLRVGEDGDQNNLFYTAGGSLAWNNFFEKQFGIVYKVQNLYTPWLSHSTQSLTLGENTCTRILIAVLSATRK